jgi:hypothetical protein
LGWDKLQQQEEKQDEEEQQRNLDSLDKEYNGRKKLDQTIDDKIKALESKAGDSKEIANLCKDIVDCQRSLNISIDLNEKIVAGSISLITTILEDNKGALEELTNAADNLNTVKSSRFQISGAKNSH